jgi:adenosylcobinamide-phosphate synthase
MFATAMLAALVVDAALGWPRALFARIGHPVTWIGALVTMLDRDWNTARDPIAARRQGMIATLVVLGLTAGLALAVQSLLPHGAAGIILVGLLAWPLVAARSLHDHVAAVVVPLATGDLAAARAAVAQIVGRDPERLDEAGIARAAIESLAENASDGVVAPLFWGAILGLPGIATYKAINTLDSMIGHRTPRHEHFGWFAARLDDWVNLVPARLTGLLFALVSGRVGETLAAMRRDAPRHRSPNAGWPEAAMATALGVRLSGPRSYGERIAQEPWVNPAAPDPGPADVERALQVYLRGMAVAGLALALVALW